MKLRDRTEAGQLLADKLIQYQDNPNIIILALPRGGVPVGYEISKKLHAPLDILIVRKLGAPWQEELAIGAIAMGGVKVLNEEIVKSLQISPAEIEQIAAQEQTELDRRNRVYRHGEPFPDLKNKIVILVDDGLATGATMRAAVAAVKQAKPEKLIVAVPVAPSDTYHEFKKTVDEIICLSTPELFYSISQWYDYFPQTSDEEVMELLKLAKNTHIP